MTEKQLNGSTEAINAGSTKVSTDPAAADPFANMRKNAPAIITDIALGVLFFGVAKFTDLTTAALVGAAAGLVLVVVQRFLKTVDLLGGLALFGIVMLGISAGFALLIQDDAAIKLRTTFLGGVTCVLFFVDSLFDGRYLGARLMRYMPGDGIIRPRLSRAVALVTFVTAAVNLVLAVYAPESIWLFYTSFGDIILTVAMFALMGRYIGLETPAGS